MNSKAILTVGIAIFAGLCIDNIGSMILSFFGAMVRATLLAAEGNSREEIMQIINSNDMYTTYNFVMSVPGLVISIFAGYACAKIAKRPDYKVAACFACLDTCTASVITYLLIPDAYREISNWPFIGLMIVGTVAAVMLGAKFAMLSIRNPPRLDDFTS